MKLQHLFVIIGAAMLVGCSPADPKITSGGQQSQRAPDPAIIAKLQEIVELRQQLLKGHQAMVQTGKAEDDGAAEIALAEARLQLARERGQTDLVTAELRQLVAAQERRLEMAKKKVEVGAAGPDEVARVRVVLLEAQVRLQREQQEAKGK
jgi:outer membrane protein TolC